MGYSIKNYKKIKTALKLRISVLLSEQLSPANSQIIRLFRVTVSSVLYDILKYNSTVNNKIIC